jgi:hypothetical protein
MIESKQLCLVFGLCYSVIVHVYDLKNIKILHNNMSLVDNTSFKFASSLLSFDSALTLFVASTAISLIGIENNLQNVHESKPMATQANVFNRCTWF